MYAAANFHSKSSVIVDDNVSCEIYDRKTMIKYAIKILKRIEFIMLFMQQLVMSIPVGLCRRSSTEDLSIYTIYTESKSRNSVVRKYYREI